MGEALHRKATEVRKASDMVANENDFKHIDAEEIRLSSFSPRRSSRNERKGLLQTVLEQALNLQMEDMINVNDTPRTKEVTAIPPSNFDSRDPIFFHASEQAKPDTTEVKIEQTKEPQ